MSHKCVKRGILRKRHARGRDIIAPMNQRRALRQLYMFWSAAWIALVLFGVHFHWSHHMPLAEKLIWTAGFALIPPASGYLLFQFAKWIYRAIRPRGTDLEQES